MNAEIQALLHTLSPKELREVKTVIDSVLAVKKGTETETEDYILDALLKALRSRNVLILPKKCWGNSWTAYLNVKDTLHSWLEGLLPSMTKMEKARLGSIVANAYIRWLEHIGREITVKDVLLMSGNIPKSVEAAFPGYVQAGLFYVLVRSMKG